MAKKEYKAPEIKVEKAKKEYVKPTAKIVPPKFSHKGHGGFFYLSSVGKIFLPFVVLVLVFRVMFGDKGETVSFYTMLRYIQTFQPDLSFFNWVIKNFRAVSDWSNSGSGGILEALKTIVSVFPMLANIAMFIVALLWNAIQVIFFVFGLLFVVV